MAPDASPSCRVLIGGFGRPAQRDLDFGHQLVSYLEELEWPAGVVVEDISYAAPLVLHRLQELRPAKVVLVGTVPREGDDPGALRRYRLDCTPPRRETVQRRLEESAGGMVDLDHTLAVARHWGGLPADTVIIEIQPADCSFGLGFSEELAARFDAILTMVREEADVPEPAMVADPALEPAMRDRTPPTASAPPSSLWPQPNAAEDAAGHTEGGGGVVDLVDYARRHQQARALEHHRGRSVALRELNPPRLEMAGRSRPWSIGIEGGGDWYDVMPFEGGTVGVVMGDVPGRGVEATALKSDVRMALRAYAAQQGHSPGGLLRSLDRFMLSTSMGEMTTAIYLTIDEERGEVRVANAGHCPPLVLDAGGSAMFFDGGRSLPLGTLEDVERPEGVFSLPVGSTLVLFTDGLVEGRRRSITDGLAQLRRAVANGPRALDALCDHVLEVCLRGGRRDDDVSVLALRRLR